MYIYIYHWSFMGVTLTPIKRLTSDCLMHTKGIKY